MQTNMWLLDPMIMNSVIKSSPDLVGGTDVCPEGTPRPRRGQERICWAK
jgi:hypothetical protein